MRETRRGSCLPPLKRNLAAISHEVSITWRLASRRRRRILFAPRNPTHPKRKRENNYAVETDSHPVTEYRHVRSANAATESAGRTPGRRASAGPVRDRDAEDTQREHPQAARRGDA